MAENSAGSPIFADRYRFQPVGNDWDTGRSGFTHLVFDIKKERLGVMKRAELKSQQAVDNLKNEVAVLLDLKGEGVPQLYDTGEAEYGSKKFFYIVIEYIDGIRVGKKIEDLTVTERADILLQFWSLLTTSQRMGIVNGDIDLKHLFWRRDKKQLLVIDWGNARLNIKPNNKSEFAFDLARAAEIIYTLVSRKGHAPASGSLALPKDTSLLTGLAPVPSEFRTLCKWAPRTPTNGSQSPLTALELYDATKKWLKGIPYKPVRRTNWVMRLVFIVIIIGAVFLGVAPNSPIRTIILPLTTTASNTLPPATFTEVITQTETAVITETIPTETPVLTETSTPTPTITQTPTVPPTIPVTPTPQTYTVILLDTSANDFPASKCWVNNLTTSEGLSKRLADENMQFKVDNNRPTSYLVEVDFSTCSTTNQIAAIGLNVWIQQLEIERTVSGQPEDGRQFGIFLEDVNGNRREYTLWVDKDNKLQLRVQEKNTEPLNMEVRVGNLEYRNGEGNLKIQGGLPNVSAELPIQIFLEINNQGLDIIYLKEGPKLQKELDATSLSPANQMIIIDEATRPTLGEIVKIGLLGYGGEIRTVIWPMVFFGEGITQP